MFGFSGLHTGLPVALTTLSCGYFFAFLYVTAEGFSFLAWWWITYSDCFPTQLSVEPFCICFKDPVLAEEIIPLLKFTCSLTFCLDLLLQLFPHNWYIYLLHSWHYTAFQVVFLFFPLTRAYVCISVRAGKSLSFFRISFSIFFYPERFSLCFSFVFLSIWFVCLVMIDAVLWTIWLLSVSFRGLPMFTLITLMALLAMSIASCTQACFLYFFPLLLLPTVLIYDLSWQGHFSPVIFLLFQMQLWVLVSSITMFFLAVISMTGGV